MIRPAILVAAGIVSVALGYVVGAIAWALYGASR